MSHNTDKFLAQYGDADHIHHAILDNPNFPKGGMHNKEIK
jgi:hypothetical protein